MPKAVVLPVQAALFDHYEVEPGQVSKQPLERASYYAALLDFFAKETPEFAPFFRKARWQIQHHARRTADSDEAAIFRALGEGCARVNEIAEEAKLPENQAYKILRRLHRQGFVTRTESLKDRGRGGDRRSYLYWIAD